MITLSVTAVFVLTIVFIALTKPKLLYYIMVFFAGWYSIFLDVGLMITAYRLTVLVFLFCIPVYLASRKGMFRLPQSTKYLFVFIFYAVITSVTSQFYIPESNIVDFTRGQGRWLFQIVMLFINVTPAFLPLLFFKRKEDVETTAKVFISSTFILCLFGWIQTFIFYLYGIDVFPVFREGLIGSRSQSMGVDMLGMTLFRMHSLGGEPKDFAITAVVSIFLLILTGVSGKRSFRFRGSLVAFFLASLFMSLSTSGLVVLLAGMALIAILSFFIKDVTLGFVFKSIAVFVVVALMLTAFLIIKDFLTMDSAKELMLERTIRRSPIELFDAAVIDFLSVHPGYGIFGVGLGNIHLYAWDNLVQYASENRLAGWVLKSYYSFVFVPNSGYLRIISEIGIVGLGLFLYAYLLPVRLNFKYLRYVHGKFERDMVLSLNLLAVITIVTYLLRYFHANYAYIVLGLVYFLNRELAGSSNAGARRRGLRKCS